MWLISHGFVTYCTVECKRTLTCREESLVVLFESERHRGHDWAQPGHGGAGTEADGAKQSWVQLDSVPAKGITLLYSISQVFGLNWLTGRWMRMWCWRRILPPWPVWLLASPQAALPFRRSRCRSDTCLISTSDTARKAEKGSINTIFESDIINSPSHPSLPMCQHCDCE